MFRPSVADATFKIAGNGGGVGGPGGTVFVRGNTALSANPLNDILMGRGAALQRLTLHKGRRGGRQAGRPELRSANARHNTVVL